MHDDPFQTNRAEPLALVVTPQPTPEIFGDARCLRIEFSCRGDRVPGRLLLPASGPKPFPVILFQHGIGGCKESPYMESAAPWIRGGVAIASIDFPLHGERASAKLSQRLIESVPRGASADPLGELLWMEFARQAVLDLRRCADALDTQAEIDCKRLAYAGFSLGAMVGAAFCAADPRPRAGALALGGGGFGPEAVDPCTSARKISPRPLLFVNATRDDVMPREATEALYEAAGEPKSIHWYDADHSNLPGQALKTMWLFLKEHLDIP